MRPSVVKSPEAQEFEAAAILQIPYMARQMLEGDVRATIKIYYMTARPDLDESIVLDVMQAKYQGKGKARVLVRKGVYINDRQVKEKHIYHGIDKKNPRVEIQIEPLCSQVADLFGQDDARSMYERISDAILEAWMPHYRNAMPGELRIGCEVHLNPRTYIELRRSAPPRAVPELLLSQAIMGHPVRSIRDQVEEFLLVKI